MPRATSKPQLITEANSNYNKLLELISSIDEKAFNTPFCFDPSKKEAHWARDKNIRDILVHLYEWHKMLINFVNSNLSSDDIVPFLPLPYNWKNYGDLNMVFWQIHQSTPYLEALAMFKTSHNDVMALLNTFNDDELFTKKHFKWTGTTSLGAYFVSATASHYTWAITKIKAHIKNCG